MSAPELLEDVLQPGLRVVFCGTALGRTSYERKAYYAHPRNMFWRALYEVGLTDRPLKPEEYRCASTNTDICESSGSSLISSFRCERTSAIARLMSSRCSYIVSSGERLAGLDLTHFKEGHVIRVFADQYFSAPHTIKPVFANNNVIVGENAFVLYRTHDQYANLPPSAGWKVRYLEKDGVRVNRRGDGVLDRGHYVLRIAAHGNRDEIIDGPPQGIFAPEYCDAELNFLSKCLLAWLITQTIDSPYVAAQGDWLEEILQSEGILDKPLFERRGLTRNGLANCPLCLKQIRYSELHDTILFSEEDSLLNAAAQIINATRSTIVNLFHVQPLTYSDVCHNAQNVAWGHAICNTKLGQRRCFSVAELKDMGIKIAALRDGQFETFAWASDTFDLYAWMDANTVSSTRPDAALGRRVS